MCINYNTPSFCVLNAVVTSCYDVRTRIDAGRTRVRGAKATPDARARPSLASRVRTRMHARARYSAITFESANHPHHMEPPAKRPKMQQRCLRGRRKEGKITTRARIRRRGCTLECASSTVPEALFVRDLCRCEQVNACGKIENHGPSSYPSSYAYGFPPHTRVQ